MNAVTDLKVGVFDYASSVNAFIGAVLGVDDWKDAVPMRIFIGGTSWSG